MMKNEIRLRNMASDHRDINGMSIYWCSAQGCRKRVDSDSLNSAVQPVDCRKVDMIRIMREVGNSIEVTGAKLRIGTGIKHKAVMTAAVIGSGSPANAAA